MNPEVKINQANVQTVLADLELALTFAAMAKTSDNPETQERNRNHARDAYLTITKKLMPLCSPDDREQAEIQTKLRELRRRLEDAGEEFAD